MREDTASQILWKETFLKSGHKWGLFLKHTLCGRSAIISWPTCPMVLTTQSKRETVIDFHDTDGTWLGVGRGSFALSLLYRSPFTATPWNIENECLFPILLEVILSVDPSRGNERCCSSSVTSETRRFHGCTAYLENILYVWVVKFRDY